MNINNDQEVPVGFGFALAQNQAAMRIYSTLDQTARQAVIERARQSTSKQEMQAVVADLTTFH